jgi:methyl-coenzyme M reductase subunit C
MGLGLGGGLAERGTFAKSWKNDVIAVAMSPGKRHVPKPVCEITTELRGRGVNTSELVLYAGAGTPSGCPARGAGGTTFGLTGKEIETIGRHKLALLHHGNVKFHFTYKVGFVLKRVRVPAVILCQCPVDFTDFEALKVSTRFKEGETDGKVVGIVSGIVRGESCPQEKLNEIVSVVKTCLRELS